MLTPEDVDKMEVVKLEDIKHLMNINIESFVCEHPYCEKSATHMIVNNSGFACTEHVDYILKTSK